MTDRDALIALNLMGGVGPVGVRAMAESLGSVSAILEAPPDALRAIPGVSAQTVKALCAGRGAVDVEAELARAGEAGVRLVTQADDEYPELLRAIYDPPLALYVRGAFQSRDRQAVAIVGTRSPTHYGREVARRLAGELAAGGYTIVSGLAEGVDTEAHRAALQGRGRTIGVLGGGMDCFYPPSNRDLAEAMCGSGAVVTEFPFGRRPDRTTFPMRNRIVSGMSKGIIVVEAGVTSGAMITAREAMEQGRTVFAVPGRIDVAAAEGCHALIRDGAALVRSANDVFEELGSLIPRSGARTPAGLPDAVLTGDERVLVDKLGAGGMDVDALIRETGMGAATVGSMLLGLEMKKVVRVLPGRVVELVRG